MLGRDLALYLSARNSEMLGRGLEPGEVMEDLLRQEDDNNCAVLHSTVSVEIEVPVPWRKARKARG